MLKVLNESDAQEKKEKKKDFEGQLQGLQRQWDKFRTASLRLSKLVQAGSKRLCGYRCHSSSSSPEKERKIASFAWNQGDLVKGQRDLHVSRAHWCDHRRGRSEPIVHMRFLTTVLHCEVSWNPERLPVWHPKMRSLPVVVEDGCPYIAYNVELQLLERTKAREGSKIREAMRTQKFNG